MYNQGHAETQDDIVYQQIRHCVCAFILHGEGLGPFAEIICDYQDVTVTIWGCVTDVQNIHRYTIPTDDRSEYFPRDDGVPPEISS